jgi:translation initiation factor 1
MRRRGRGAQAGESRLAYSTERPDAPPAAPVPDAPSLPRAAGGKGIRLRLGVRGAGRVVTRVLGLAGSETQVAELARILKSECGAGGSVKDGVIELQGDQRLAAQAALAARGLKSSL